MKTTSIILAAGKGTRMKSKLSKVLHPLVGRPMIWHILQSVKEFTDEPPVVIIGHQAQEIREVLGDLAQLVLQEEQLGTGHAVMQAETALRGKTDLVLVTYGDMPLLTADTFHQIVETQKSNPGPITMLTLFADEPRGFGRIERGPHGFVTAIVEEADCSPEQKKIKELNVGVFCFKADWLWENLKNIPLSAKGEYYLTDLVAIANQAGQQVTALVLEDPQHGLGINSRVHLAEAEAALRARINTRWMEAGVTLIDPQTTYIGLDVTIGQDTLIYPNTLLDGRTQIGENCRLGPNTIIRDTQIGNDCQVLSSVLEGAVLENNVDIGPYGHLRKGAHLADGVHMGNFGEVKNSYLAPGVKMGHVSYIGDANIGKDVNIGAGTITANYDGKNKNKTEIGEGAFIGVDTMLVAPLKLGKGSRTGAGSVVTKNVEEDTLVVGMPARAIRKLDQSE
ncbi:MAG: bifunctional UDP-N-acetylglucosamine diphosphorylase/glucosamine-1-phosphate N-acetyltransferase GlmU [Anaerolineae bacterium]|nr:bifunctional UDP-N-acetylglucosamine diphosphorylase/glucosamine-1-phosphate N-acetyltransferase GlmU [Anaerolineae bacterium]